MGLHGVDLRHRGADRTLDLLRDRVRLLERQVPGQLQVQRELRVTADVDDGQVVDLPHARDGERGRVGALPDRRLVSERLDVHDDVGLGQRPVHGVLDGVGRGMPLPDRGARRDADHDVGEVAAGRLPHPQPTEVHGRLDRLDRERGRPPRPRPERGP